MGDANSLTAEQAKAAHLELQGLRERLTTQTAETIDAFIAENPSHAETAKLAVAAMLLRSCYVHRTDRSHLVARPFCDRTTSAFCRTDERPERNWTHLLINIVRHAIDNGDLSSGRKVQIITFNYDRVLEHVLERQFSNRETTLHQYQSYVDILHAHGAFGSIEDTCSNPAIRAAEWASGIYVVKEHGVSAEMANTRQQIRHIIRSAGKVYSIGFAFAGPNCRLLGLSDPPEHEDRELIYCNYDANRGTTESAQRNFRGANVFEKAGREGPLTAASFIKAGFLGETPS